MRKIYDKYFDETYYTHTLDNGLRIIVFHKPEFNTTTCAFGTPYGAFNINQKVGKKAYNFNPGVAHFLEHKLFESKNEDIMNAFTSLGASVNAFTSYRETVYYFTKSGKEIKKCINLLLDFVQDLHISDDSVEKEKGIIAQEVSMYEQMPDQKLLHESYKAMYHDFPIIYDIGGNKKTIYSISKDELQLCYKLNYHPSNMIFVATTPINPEKIVNIIKDNQDKKNFSKFNKVIANNPKEKIEVVRKRHCFTMPISTDKHVLAYKIMPKFKDNNEAFYYEWCLRIFLEANFSYLNPEYQNWLDDNLINDYFGYEVDFDINCAYVMFYIENDDSSILKKLVENSLKKPLINEEILKQIKRRYIGNMFESFDDVENFTLNYIRDTLDDLDYFKALNSLMNVCLKDVEKCVKNLDFSHVSYITMRKK